MRHLLHRGAAPHRHLRWLPGTTSVGRPARPGRDQLRRLRRRGVHRPRLPGCGSEDKLYERGYCDRCALVRRTDALLGGPEMEVPAALAGVRDAIVASQHPRTAMNWLRGGAGAPLLAALAGGEVPLSHIGLDAQPAGRAVDYLRALLVAHGALPERDESLARLERRIGQLLASVEDVNDRRTLTAYVTWRILHRARNRAEHRPAARTATRHATVSLRAAIGLLGWLAARSIALVNMSQAELDRWLLEGPSNLLSGE